MPKTENSLYTGSLWYHIYVPAVEKAFGAMKIYFFTSGRGGLEVERTTKFYPDTLANLIIESYASYKDQSGPGCYMLHITLLQELVVKYHYL